MKLLKVVLLSAGVSLAAMSSAYAHDSFSFGISVGGPGYYRPPPVQYIGPPPVVYSPPPVIYYSPPPVYYRPAPRAYFYYDSHGHGRPPAFHGHGHHGHWR